MHRSPDWYQLTNCYAGLLLKVVTETAGQMQHLTNLVTEACFEQFIC